VIEGGVISHITKPTLRPQCLPYFCKSIQPWIWITRELLVVVVVVVGGGGGFGLGVGGGGGRGDSSAHSFD